MRKFGIDFHDRSVGDGAIAINMNNITAGNGFVLIAVIGHFIGAQGVIGLFQFNIASCKKAAVSLIYNGLPLQLPQLPRRRGGGSACLEL